MRQEHAPERFQLPDYLLWSLCVNMRTWQGEVIGPRFICWIEVLWKTQLQVPVPPAYPARADSD